MECFINIHVSNKYEIDMIKWQLFISYEDKLTKVYTIEENDEAWHNLINYLNANNIKFDLHREYKFSKKDIEEAELLELSIEKSVEDYFDFWTERAKCNKCNKKINTINESIILNKKIKNKYDIFTHYLGYEEIIISEKLKNIFEQENIIGASYSPIYYKNKETIIEGYYHLKLAETKMELVEPTALIRDRYCEECQRYYTQLIRSVMYFNKSNYHNEDIFYTKEWLGEGKRTQNVSVIISKKVYEILKNDIHSREWCVSPVFMI